MQKLIKVFLLTTCFLSFLLQLTPNICFANTNNIMPITDLYQNNKDSIVSVYVQGIDNTTNKVVSYSETGFIYNSDGYILTAGHIFNGLRLNPTPKIVVVKSMSNEVRYIPKLIHYEYLGKLTIHDIALLKIDNKTYKPVTLGNSDKIKIGEEVSTIGNPNGLELTLSNGIISNIRTPEYLGINKHNDGNMLQTTVPISTGNSGGPLFNSKGEVIGIVQAFDERAPWISWIIPINDIIKSIQPYIDKEEATTER